MLSPYAYLSNYYYGGTGSPSSDAHVLQSTVVKQPGSAAEHPSSAVA